LQIKQIGVQVLDFCFNVWRRNFKGAIVNTFGVLKGASRFFIKSLDYLSKNKSTTIAKSMSLKKKIYTHMQLHDTVVFGSMI
jgi:hypothetical protein